MNSNEKYFGHLTSEKEKWFYLANFTLLAFSLANAALFCFDTGINEKLLIPFTTFLAGICSLLVFKKNKSTGIFILCIAPSFIFCLRPLFVGPIWSIIGFFFIIPFFIANYFDFSSKKVKISGFISFLFCFIFVYANLYTKVKPGNFVFLKELIFLTPILFLFYFILDKYRFHFGLLQNKLTKTNEYLQKVINNSPNIFYSANRKGEYTEVNDNFLKLIGKKRNEVVGFTKKQVFKNKAVEIINISIKEDEQILTGASSLISGDLQWNNGEKILWINFNKIPFISSTGKIDGIICVMHDTTELIKKNETIKKQKDTLAEKNLELQKYINSNLELESFAYLASHDLKTPLRSIIGFSQLLQRNLKNYLSENDETFFKYIIDGSKSMHHLLEVMLSHSVIKKENFNFKSVNVNAVIKDCLKFLMPQIKKTNTIITSNVDKNIFIIADGIKLFQLFVNIISNAIKYVNQTTIPNISINCKEQKNQFLFIVKDNGIGIDNIFLDQIFIVLKRLHTNEYEGTGMGLANCKSIVEKHFGKIWAESEVGKGSTFYFTIAKLNEFKGNLSAILDEPQIKSETKKLKVKNI